MKILDQSQKFEKNAIVYAKEINQNVFLLFVIVDSLKSNKIYASIASYNNIESIGKEDPLQVMFHLDINSKEDFHYLEKYVNVLV